MDYESTALTAELRALLIDFIPVPQGGQEAKESSDPKCSLPGESQRPPQRCNPSRRDASGESEDRCVSLRSLLIRSCQSPFLPFCYEKHGAWLLPISIRERSFNGVRRKLSSGGNPRWTICDGDSIAAGTVCLVDRLIGSFDASLRRRHTVLIRCLALEDIQARFRTTRAEYVGVPFRSPRRGQSERVGAVVNDQYLHDSTSSARAPAPRPARTARHSVSSLSKVRLASSISAVFAARSRTPAASVNDGYPNPPPVPFS